MQCTPYKIRVHPWNLCLNPDRCESASSGGLVRFSNQMRPGLEVKMGFGRDFFYSFCGRELRDSASRRDADFSNQTCAFVPLWRDALSPGVLPGPAAWAGRSEKPGGEFGGFSVHSCRFTVHSCQLTVDRCRQALCGVTENREPETGNYKKTPHGVTTNGLGGANCPL